MLLLDEPLGALDLKLRRQMQVELKEIQREVGITFLYVTHDQEEALAMSDRIAVMDGGVVEQCGTPEEVYERPAKPFVAGFIGISNLMEGMVEAGGVRLVERRAVRGARAGGGDRRDAGPALGAAGEDRARREQRRHGAAARHVAERVYVGTATQVIVELEGGARIVALEQNTERARAEDRWELGDRVTVGWLPEHSLVLR